MIQRYKGREDFLFVFANQARVLSFIGLKNYEKFCVYSGKSGKARKLCRSIKFIFIEIIFLLFNINMFYCVKERESE